LELLTQEMRPRELELFSLEKSHGDHINVYKDVMGESKEYGAKSLLSGAQRQ